MSFQSDAWGGGAGGALTGTLEVSLGGLNGLADLEGKIRTLSCRPLSCQKCGVGVGVGGGGKALSARTEPSSTLAGCARAGGRAAGVRGGGVRSGNGV